MQHGNSEVSLAVTAIAAGFGKLMEFLVHAESVLGALSYIVAIAAGSVTLYFKLKNRK